MKILVIGSNSFSGQDFIDLCLTEGHQVVGMSRSLEKDKLFLRYSSNANISKFRFYQADMNYDHRFMLDCMGDECFDWVVNFACQSEVAPSWDSPWDWFQTNTVALSKLVRGICNHRVRIGKFIHISSPEIYGNCSADTGYFDYNPSTPYAASRAAGDMLLHCYQKEYDFPVSFVRSTNVYGSRQQLFKLIPRTVLRVLAGEKIQLHGGGKAIKSFIHIRDISRGELEICKETKPGRVWHLSPDSGVSVKDIVEQISQIMGKSFGDVAESVDERPGQDAAYELNSGPARGELNWTSSVSLDEGLREVVSWVKENYEALSGLSHKYEHQSSRV